MSDDRGTAAVFNEGLEPVMGETPPAPAWESLQFESLASSHGPGRWWVAGVAAALVLLVGAGSFLLVGQLGGGNDSAEGGGDDAIIVDDALPGSIEGRWVLESWQESGEWLIVEVGETAVDEPWIEFAAGTYSGWTGCNGVESTGYEFSAGFLILEPLIIQAAGCESGRAGEVFVATLAGTTDGIEVILGSDRMEWYGSNLEGQTYPLVFRREGAAPAATTTTAASFRGVVMQVSDVGGIEVVTPTLLLELPERVTRVEFHTTVIDSGYGPELCMGGVQESLPPQCSGPVATGLSMDGWADEANGVRWGDRSVVVSWPPFDGAVEVFADGEFGPPDVVFPPGELPAVCEGIELGAGVEAVHQYRATLGDLDGDVYLANDGTMVLQVVGDPVPHREALAELGGACVIEVARNTSEQRALHETVHPLIRDALGIDSYSSSTGPGGRVDIYLPVVDRATAELVAQLVDDPAAIRLIGMGLIRG